MVRENYRGGGQGERERNTPTVGRIKVTKKEELRPEM